MDSLHTQIISEINYPMLFWTIVIAITGIIGAFIVFLQYKKARDAHALNKRTVELTLRPSVVIDSIKCKLAKQKVELPSKIFITLKNSGKLPAKKIQITCNGKITLFGDPSSEGLYAPIPLPNDMKPSLGIGLSMLIVIPINHSGLAESAPFALNTFEVVFDFKYQGSDDKSYYEHYKYRYDRALDDLININ